MRNHKQWKLCQLWLSQKEIIQIATFNQEVSSTPTYFRMEDDFIYRLRVRITIPFLILIVLAPSVLPRSVKFMNNEPICIKADGTVFPSSAPLQRIGNEYHVTSDINCSSDGIIVEADNLILDGSNFVLQGYGTDATGIDLSQRVNITVRNFEIRGFYHGILMDSSMAIDILNNTLTSWNTYALRAMNSSDIMISENRINQFIWHGIEFVQIFNSSFSDNEVGNPSRVSRNYAFWHENSMKNRITSNNITDNDYGIYINGSNDTTIRGNVIANNQYDLRMDNSLNNLVEQNNITALRYSAVGIYLYDSFNNTVRANTIEKCYCGLYSYGSSDNTIYQNNFLQNTMLQAFSVNSTNKWSTNLPSFGNYWSDYVGVDLDHDGVGDTPYVIDANNTDYYPFMNPYIVSEFAPRLVLLLSIVATLSGALVLRRKRIT